MQPCVYPQAFISLNVVPGRWRPAHWVRSIHNDLPNLEGASGLADIKRDSQPDLYL